MRSRWTSNHRRQMKCQRNCERIRMNGVNSLRSLALTPSRKQHWGESASRCVYFCINSCPKATRAGTVIGSLAALDAIGCDPNRATTISALGAT